MLWHFLLLLLPLVVSICHDGYWKVLNTPFQSYFGLKRPYSEIFSNINSSSLNTTNVLSSLCPSESFYHNCFFRGSNRSSSVYHRLWMPREQKCLIYSSSKFLTTIKHKRLVLIGDSVMAQIWKNLICSLYKETEVEIEFAWSKYQGRTIEVPNAYNNRTCPLGGDHCYLNHWRPMYIVLPRFNATLTLHMVAKYVPGLLSTIMEQVQLEPGNIAIINFGLHYNDESDYRNDMEILAEEVEEFQANNTIRRIDERNGSSKVSLLYMETAPQHFSHVKGGSGYYSPATAGARCSPVNETEEPALDWRNNVANVLLKPLLPVIQIAKPLYSQWDAHVDGDGSTVEGLARFADCTHWCSPSGMFQFINTMVLNFLHVHGS